VPFKLFCRKDSFKELSAMAVEYGTPQFFVTFTERTPPLPHCGETAVRRMPTLAALLCRASE